MKKYLMSTAIVLCLLVSLLHADETASIIELSFGVPLTMAGLALCLLSAKCYKIVHDVEHKTREKKEDEEETCLRLAGTCPCCMASCLSGASGTLLTVAGGLLIT